MYWVLGVQAKKSNAYNKDQSIDYCHMSFSLNSLKGGYIGDYIGDYYRGY